MDKPTPRKVTRRVVEVSPAHHKALKHLATDTDGQLKDVAGKVIAAGLRALKQQPATPAA